MRLKTCRFTLVERIGSQLIGTRTIFAAMVAIFNFSVTGTVVCAQLPLPVATNLVTPLYLDFHGDWTCTDGTSVAQIKVQGQHHEHSSLSLSGPWTGLTERQEGFTSHYFVGYDRDKNQVLMIDADDPASVSYVTEGWRGTQLTFKSVDTIDRPFPPHHILYEVKTSKQFTVSWEILDGNEWIRDPAFTCSKTANVSRYVHHIANEVRK
jgi:hypothetical protein